MRIAINGCGIAGPTLAWWLKEFGHEPVLFDKASALREGGYIIDFWGTGYDVAEKMGILPDLKKDAYRIKCVRTVSSGGWTTSSVKTKAFLELTGGRYFSIARSDLARHLFKACKGIETNFGKSITGLDERGGMIAVTLSDGREEEFDLVVGADGLHSKVRELTFGPQDQFEKPVGFYVAAFILEGYQPRDELAYVSHTNPGHQISRVALRDDQTLFLFVVSKDLITRQPADEAGEKALLRDVFGNMGWEANAILAWMDEVADVYFDRVSQIKMPDWSRGRVALIGDAAACPSLLAGEGTGLAMTEAYVLAGELHKASGDHRSAFSAYQALLQPLVIKKQDAALKFANFFAPKDWPALVARDVLANVTSLPVLGKHLLKSAFRTGITLPDYHADKESNLEALK